MATDERFEAGTWVNVVGTFQEGVVPWPQGDAPAPTMTATRAATTPEPEMPYEYR